MYLVHCIGWIILIVLLSLPSVDIKTLLKRKVQEPKRECPKKKRQALKKENEDI
jgi:hypothetical protein